MSDSEFNPAFASVIIAVLLAYDKNSDDINWLGNFVTAIGCELLVIATQAACNEAQAEQLAASSKDQEFENLKTVVQQLQQEVKELNAAIASLTVKKT